ncbi:sulfite exporter TauE/SafE family protein [Roseivivax sp. CAU 1761]
MIDNAALLFATGILGGMVNAAAGGAKLFVFPLLVASGLPPIVANATSTIAVWPAQLPAAWVYRHELRADAGQLLRRLLPVLAGGLFGALALIFSSERAFMAVVPFLLAIAVGAIALGPRSAELMRRAFPGNRIGPATALLLFFCGLYGGYFGAGLGFMLLAVLAASDAVPLGRVNGAKNLLAAAINTTAVAPLALSGLVRWDAAVAVLLGGLVGGYLGAAVTRKIPERPMRLAVSAIGVVLAVSFLI